MKAMTVSIVEGKKSFSRLIDGALKKKEDVIVTKRGKPVVVIVPYDEYQRSRRMEGYRKIMDVRSAFLNKAISSDEVFKESRKQLEKRH